MLLKVLFASRDVERDHGSTLSVLKSLYLDGVPTNIYQWKLRDDSRSVVTQVVSLCSYHNNNNNNMIN